METIVTRRKTKENSMSVFGTREEERGGVKYEGFGLDICMATQKRKARRTVELARRDEKKEAICNKKRNEGKQCVSFRRKRTREEESVPKGSALTSVWLLEGKKKEKR